MEVNKFLDYLDNGGFKIVLFGSPVPLMDSDVKFGNTYVDRQDDNKTKSFIENKNCVLAWAMSFQEAVESLPERFDVDLRY